MKKIIYVLYGICIVGMLSFFLYECGYFHDEVFQKRKDVEYLQLQSYESREIEDEEAPAGLKQEYVIRDLNVTKGRSSLVFYTIHQNVKVYVGKELVYSIEPSSDNLFGKTPGNIWNIIPVYREDAGSEIRVVITPVYKSSIKIIPEFYYGSKESILGDVVQHGLLPLAMSLIAIIFGIVFIAFTVFKRWSVAVDDSLLLMGIFSADIGLWKLTDISAMSLIFPESIAWGSLPFLTLLASVIPFILYVKKLFLKESNIWYLPCIASVAVTVISLALQIMGIADLRQTLWANHIIMGFAVIVGAIMLVKEIYEFGMNRRLKIMIICIGSAFVGTLTDILIYYISSGTSMTVLGMLGLLVYVIVLGVMSIEEARQLIFMGMQAKHYEKMAYHDQLTGFFNRAAYAEYIKQAGLKMDDCILAMFDLNDLKHCNDTLGHEKGDSYILKSAKLIEEVFGDAGKCYRMGGDEFCVLMQDVSIEECERRVEELTRRTKVWNKEREEQFKIEIACGYACYDKASDYDLGDTLRRADRMMYHRKLKMKREAM